MTHGVRYPSQPRKIICSIQQATTFGPKINIVRNSFYCSLYLDSFTLAYQLACFKKGYSMSQTMNNSASFDEPNTIMNHYDNDSVDTSSYSAPEDDKSRSKLQSFKDFNLNKFYGSKRSKRPTESNNLVQKETKYLAWSKLLVLFVLGIAATGTAIGAFLYTKHNVDRDFSTRYNDFANSIIAVSQINAVHIFQAYENLSLQMTTVAIAANSQWPFVQFPNLDVQAAQAMNQTGAGYIAFTPLVLDTDRDAYENFTVENQEWIQSTLQNAGEIFNYSLYPFLHEFNFSSLTGANQPALRSELYAPVAQTYPLTERAVHFINYNVFHYPYFGRVFDAMVETGRAVLSEVLNLYEDYDTSGWGSPVSLMVAPIYDTPGSHDTLVGAILVEMPWEYYFHNLIPEGIDGIFLVVRNTCDQEFTYIINGPEVVYLGVGDLHDSQYNNHEVSSEFTAFVSLEECRYSLHLFPSDELAGASQTRQPVVNAIAVVLIFVATGLVFVMYDWLVEQRQEKVMSSATRTNAIVESLFPANVRDRLLVEVDTEQNHEGQKEMDKKKLFSNNVMTDWKEKQGCETANFHTTKPIADLFPHATVLFGDIAGFTAWSSVRAPAQVFTLLETVYCAFDRIAKKLGVFKVETIGDSYVAATGLPEARQDHAEVMARFAMYCLAKLKQVVNRLDSTLGPGTAELSMRFGIHSGPVTAGVLRGEKSRFQLFGDTVNTAARMESTGLKDKVQVSQETADVLAASGKSRWVTPRETKVIAKGKGELQTYWLMCGSSSVSHSTLSSITSEYPLRGVNEEETSGDAQVPGSKQTASLGRFIDWNFDVLQGLLKKIIAMRFDKDEELTYDINSFDRLTISNNPRAMVLDEVKDFIRLPGTVTKYKQDPDEVELNPAVVQQLLDYVRAIASMYSENPFHSFAHATHVGQSVTKLLARVVTPDSTNCMTEQCLHKYTYGITSDPLMQFACSFSAMIHDVDHPGVPNAQLVHEKTEAAIHYKNKSVAEQNSVDVAWDLLMKPAYRDLRACIYTNQAELDRFRQLVVNAVMATDIVDKELSASRLCRWKKAFNGEGCDSTDTTSSSSNTTSELIEMETSNRKATIVIEHLIQASDVAHTMQHWHIFTKWNEKLFEEMYNAYESGRAKNDPSLNWYQSELGFFDFYIIPLAKKLKECGVFGVASDEYLNYAVANRREWELKGKEIVLKYLSKYQYQDLSDNDSASSCVSA